MVFVENGMESDELWITVVIFVLIILIVILFIIFRQEIFGYGVMSKEEALAKGFGYFSDPVVTGCSNESGKCSDVGIQTTVINCIVNTKTGKGCINSEGYQIFTPTISHTTCVPQCRSSVWEVQSTTECKNNEGDEYGCVTETTSGVSGYRLVTKKCVPNDTSGVNTCTFSISEQIYLASNANSNINSNLNDSGSNINIDNNTNLAKNYNPVTNSVEYPSVIADDDVIITEKTVFPDGCVVDGNGQTVTCEVGSSYQEMVTCSDPKYPFCGVWGYRHISPIIDINGNYNKPSIDISPCSTSSQIIPSSLCYSFDTNEPIVGDLNLFKSGYLPLPMGCVSEYISTATNELWNNWNPNNPLEVGDGSICKPYNYEDSVNVLYNFENEIPTVINNDGYPNCVVPCIYYNTPQGNYSEEIKRIIGKFHILIKDNYFLTLNNIPCPVDLDDSNFLAPGQYVNVSDIQPQLSDCLSSPFVPLRNTPCLFVNLDNFITDQCTSQEIILQSAIIITFKPTRISTSPNVLYCRIISILGKNYVGILNIQPDGYLTWTQKNINLDSNISIEDIPNSEFITTWNGNSYDIINTTTQIKVQSTDNIDLNLLNVQLGTSPELTDNEKLNTLLQFRQNRIPKNCNILNTQNLPKYYSST